MRRASATVAVAHGCKRRRREARPRSGLAPPLHMELSFFVIFLVLI
jgi:hypothetical protein